VISAARVGSWGRAFEPRYRRGGVGAQPHHGLGRAPPADRRATPLPYWTPLMREEEDVTVLADFAAKGAAPSDFDAP
jgi:hypothetical protein